jgi:hypothetical protein
MSGLETDTNMWRGLTAIHILFKRRHGLPMLYVMFLSQAQTWTSNVICHVFIHKLM